MSSMTSQNSSEGETSTDEENNTSGFPGFLCEIDSMY